MPPPTGLTLAPGRAHPHPAVPVVPASSRSAPGGAPSVRCAGPGGQGSRSTASGRVTSTTARQRASTRPGGSPRCTLGSAAPGPGAAPRPRGRPAAAALHDDDELAGGPRGAPRSQDGDDVGLGVVPPTTTDERVGYALGQRGGLGVLQPREPRGVALVSPRQVGTVVPGQGSRLVAQPRPGEPGPPGQVPVLPAVAGQRLVVAAHRLEDVPGDRADRPDHVAERGVVGIPEVAGRGIPLTQPPGLGQARRRRPVLVRPGAAEPGVPPTPHREGRALQAGALQRRHVVVLRRGVAVEEDDHPALSPGGTEVACGGQAEAEVRLPDDGDRQPHRAQDRLGGGAVVGDHHLQPPEDPALGVQPGQDEIEHRLVAVVGDDHRARGTVGHLPHRPRRLRRGRTQGDPLAQPGEVGVQQRRGHRPRQPSRLDELHRARQPVRQLAGVARAEHQGSPARRQPGGDGPGGGHVLVPGHRHRRRGQQAGQRLVRHPPGRRPGHPRPPGAVRQQVGKVLVAAGCPPQVASDHRHVPERRLPRRGRRRVDHLLQALARIKVAQGHHAARPACPRLDWRAVRRDRTRQRVDRQRDHVGAAVHGVGHQAAPGVPDGGAQQQPLVLAGHDDRVGPGGERGIEPHPVGAPPPVAGLRQVVQHDRDPCRAGAGTAPRGESPGGLPRQQPVGHLGQHRPAGQRTLGQVLQRAGPQQLGIAQVRVQRHPVPHHAVLGRAGHEVGQGQGRHPSAARRAPFLSRPTSTTRGCRA